jgi:FAD/FMN-containing dehydrogenase
LGSVNGTAASGPTRVYLLAAALADEEAGACVGFLGDDGDQGVRRAYPAATLERLVEVKRRYDPDNLFRLNSNVPPGLEPSRGHDV